jgi:hypothetical protein
LLITRIVIGLLITGLPIVVILAWYHGENSHQRLTHGEMTIISILLLLGAGMLWVFAKPEADHESHEQVAVDATKEAGAPAPAEIKSSVVAPAGGKLRLAVLPFQNLSPDPANAFFTDGMHEEILSTLAIGAANLVTSAPGLGPAQVTRDPLYSMALATNARYKALEKKLEAEIIANRSLL